MKTFRLIHASLFSLALSPLVSCGSFKPPADLSSGKSASASPSNFSTDALKNIVFQMGATHIDGRYRFTAQNFLEEGAQRILDLGTREIFVYMERNFRTRYPELGGTRWGDQEIKNLTDLAKSKPFENIFAMPFNTYLLTTFSFGLGDGPFRDQHPDDYDQKLINEENEFYELTKYLMRAYDGSGKTFVLKNWEGDWWGLKSYDPSRSITPSDAQDLVRVFSARQKGVLRARRESTSSSVWVLHAIEVNRVADLIANPSLGRIANRVIPFVNPPADMTTYSIYDTLLDAGTESVIEGRLTKAVQYLLNNTPDPLGLGSKRIILSEVGIPENGVSSNAESEKRLNVALRVGQNLRLHSASFWELYDNDCNYKNTSTPIQDSALAPNDARRPRNTDCRGFYIFRPDGSEPQRNRVLRNYWAQIQNQLPTIPQDFRPIPEATTPVVPKSSGFKWEAYSFASDCSSVEVTVSGQKGSTVKAYAREANDTWDFIGEVDTAIFQNSMINIPLSQGLQEKLMTTGLRFTLTDEGADMWDTTPELLCKLP
ncbi:MAG: hypothetical protein K2X47_04715 [Bdellovibrionales bacterium]|nr:hypothetical protein [Bdellovibrionales bacterium]